MSETELLQQLTNNRLDMVKTQGEIAKVEATISQAIAKHKEKLDKLRQVNSDLEDAIKTEMARIVAAGGPKKIENEVLVITYIEPTSRTTIDVTKLRKERPELVEEFSQTTPVADSIRIKVKE